jgi:hypothetical protein
LKNPDSKPARVVNPFYLEPLSWKYKEKITDDDNKENYRSRYFVKVQCHD